MKSSNSFASHRARRARGLLPAVALLFLGMAGCMGVPQTETVGPSNKVDTFSDPIIVTRDNLAVGGEVYVNGSADYFKTAGGTVGSDTTYFSQAKWFNATAYAKLEEFRAKWQWSQRGGIQGWISKGKFQDFYSPALPLKNFFAPGLADYGTRTGVMVHGNIYRVTATGQGGGNPAQTASPRYVKLSDDVPVVPVVVITWKNAGAADDQFTPQKRSAAGAIDFYPAAPMPRDPLAYYNPGSATWVGAYDVQSPTIHQGAVNMAWSDYYPNVACPWKAPLAWLCDETYDHWTADFAQFRPNGAWTPPDEIWTKCNVQFQAVDAVVLELPPGWVPSCNGLQVNTPNPQLTYTAHYKGTAWEDWAKYVAFDLKPVFVSFAPFQCDSQGGWDGSTKGNVVEIDTAAEPITLAHELGHIITGPDHYKGLQPGNIMLAFNMGTNVDVAAQCPTARITAGAYSARFDEFNRVTGRTYSATAVPDLADVASGPPDDGEFDPNPAPIHCCLLQDASDVVVSASTCTTLEVPVDQCTIECCGNNYTTMTTYKCVKLGFSSFPCPPK